MAKINRLNKYFTASALSVIALMMGSRLNRGLIKHLGGQYSIFTEFYSDWAYIAYHKFFEFRNAALILTVLSAILLIWLYSRSSNSKRPLYLSLAFFAVGCTISAVVISPPAEIAHYIFSRACCSALFIIAVNSIVADKNR